jgi:Holliday junction resolvasome RuvABC endonuclease subunit
VNRDLKILAIDPGSKNMGWAYLLDDHLVFAGTTQLYGNIPKTYTTIWYWVRGALESGIRLSGGTTFRPNELVIETFFPGRMRGATVIPELRGIIKLAAYQIGTATITEVPPGTVKKNIAGNGRASKSEVKAAVNRKYGISVSSSDEADAIAIALAGRERIIQRMEESDGLDLL